jgi:hypothetical protein
MFTTMLWKAFLSRLVAEQKGCASPDLSGLVGVSAGQEPGHLSHVRRVQPDLVPAEPLLTPSHHFGVAPLSGRLRLGLESRRVERLAVSGEEVAVVVDEEPLGRGERRVVAL